MVLEINHAWTSTGSTAALTPVYVDFPPVESVLTVAFSTLATSNSVEFQTAQESSGPWFTEASTAISTGVSGQVALRVTGPYLWARPQLKTASTGAYTIRLLGVS